MALQFHESPFHVTHDDETASKMALKMDLSIFITNCLKQLNLKQSEAAKLLNLTQSRVSELANGKIEKFTIDAMIDMLDCLGFRANFTMSNAGAEASPQIVITKSA
ncbi:XRE family transcriptional regulator [Pseudomonas phytophila]|uniref:XRE family transcriptional regulator n=2 Tax=Pseudomonas TaxID=286 RepID=A0ABY6FI43_9PSED|nr:MULTISPECIES: XRE family transcriptional regulator [Pseudomonas]MCD5974246.1 XRE family transcriptional regulator [Pseudomonas quasicaspiana]MCI8209047.1 Cro/Cl family transcriptional regulator [Pseudomonas sp. S25]MDG6403034.1 XRE family transcriptional regulator [Pseudomonas quasicaspiana]UXZ97329.1 XRE family transcriptional regulator [Pseudomonas phytophila]